MVISSDYLVRLVLEKPSGKSKAFSSSEKDFLYPIHWREISQKRKLFYLLTEIW